MEWASGLTWPFEIDTSSWWIALGSALVAGFLLGALPVGAAEAVALAAGAIPSTPLRIAVVVIFTAGHVLGKALWYWLGTLESRVTRPRLRRWIEQARGLALQYPTLGVGVTAMSALTSVPPFHLIAVTAGIVRSSFALFVCVSFAGRLVRFGALAAFPALVRHVFS